MLSRRHWAGEGRHERDHQQRKHPSEPDPRSRDDAGRSHQTHPPPVIGGERPKPRRQPNRRRQVQHPAGSADLGAQGTDQNTEDHRVGAVLPHECVQQEHRRDESHQDGQNDVDHAARPRRVRRGVCGPALDVPRLSHWFAFPASPQAAYWRPESRLSSRSKTVSWASCAS
jgi:hypothetical protein